MSSHRRFPFGCALVSPAPCSLRFGVPAALSRGLCASATSLVLAACVLCRSTFAKGRVDVLAHGVTESPRLLRGRSDDATGRPSLPSNWATSPRHACGTARFLSGYLRFGRFRSVRPSSVSFNARAPIHQSQVRINMISGSLAWCDGRTWHHSPHKCSVAIDVASVSQRAPSLMGFSCPLCSGVSVSWGSRVPVSGPPLGDPFLFGCVCGCACAWFRF